MHRFVLDVYSPVDHRDGNGLNNQRRNLRKATKSQNGQNRDKQANNTSGFKGVSWHSASNRWVAQITIDKKRTHLGLFVDKEKAACAYNKAAKLHYGSFAKLNKEAA